MGMSHGPQAGAGSAWRGRAGGGGSPVRVPAPRRAHLLAPILTPEARHPRPPTPGPAAFPGLPPASLGYPGALSTRPGLRAQRTQKVEGAPGAEGTWIPRGKMLMAWSDRRKCLQLGCRLWAV